MRNVALLESTMQHIVDHPEAHNQRVYVNPFSDCGTAACFAGWACILSGFDAVTLYKTTTPTARDTLSIAGTAMRLLGLDVDEAATMFDPGNTRAMLQLMVKDLVNGDPLRGQEFYRREAHDDAA